MSHPNTIAATISGGAATLIVYLANTYAHTHLNPADGAGIATVLAAAVLFVGRRGIKASLSSLWLGGDKPAPPAP